MLFEDTKILEFNQHQKSDKAPFIIYADLEFIIERTDGCKNNPENSSPTTARVHIPSGFPVASFRGKENKHDVYRGKDCVKRFCESLREHAMKIINFKREKMKVLTKYIKESYENAKICYISCKERVENKYLNNKKCHKVRYHCQYAVEYRGAAHSICNVKYNVSRKISIVFRNESNCDYHFIIEELAEKFLKKLLF